MSSTFESIGPRKATRRVAWPGARFGVASPTCTAAPKCPEKATERYLDALASIDQDTTLDDILHRLSQPTYWHGRRVRALQPRMFG